jgi:hypothetical protein
MEKRAAKTSLSPHRFAEERARSFQPRNLFFCGLDRGECRPLQKYLPVDSICRFYILTRFFPKTLNKRLLSSFAHMQDLLEML